MRRREFIALLSGAAAWPPAVLAQPERPRNIVMLVSTEAEDPDTQARVTAFLQGLQQLGWTDGRNVRIVAVPDPVGSGFVESLSRPGGNATGFTQFEYSLSAKWLELLKQIAPNVTRVAVLRDAAMPDGIGQFAVIQSVAPSIGIDVTSVNIRDAAEIERAITAFARSPNGGLVVTSSAFAAIHRDLIIKLAARHQLPATYYRRVFVTSGGLISYGPDFIDQFRNAATYIDRIFKGEKPADMPVQAPTKYELVINLKAAKAIGLTVPPTLIARADEVIE
jgi:putative ABC transport system substrate-binding protein